MTDISRRAAIKTVAAAVGATAFSSVPAFAAEKEKATQEPSKFHDQDLIVKPLPFDPKKLQGISEKLIQSHWENNYTGSVKTLNAVNKKISAALTEKDYPAFAFNGLKREHLMRTGSVVFHEMYFGNLGGNGKAAGEIEKFIKASFGDFNIWEAEFRKIAQGLSGGSGWVVLGYNYHLKRLENYWAWDHMHGAAGSVPLLVMDMYEHAYQMDYGAAAAKYIDAFFKNIEWSTVEQRLERAKNFKWM
ncbi:MAG: superoxide dismutase [Pseudobdellovibrionaceae bacterium]